MSRARSMHRREEIPYNILIRKPGGKRHYEEPYASVTAIIKWILEKQDRFV
jgi:hypothetical protein